LEEAKFELNQLLTDVRLKDAVLLVLAHKAVRAILSVLSWFEIDIDSRMLPTL
jgi:hypothetical protein